MAFFFLVSVLAFWHGMDTSQNPEIMILIKNHKSRSLQSGRLYFLSFLVDWIN
jgi:hypothetical protein